MMHQTVAILKSLFTGEGGRRGTDEAHQQGARHMPGFRQGYHCWRDPVRVSSEDSAFDGKIIRSSKYDVANVINDG